MKSFLACICGIVWLGSLTFVHGAGGSPEAPTVVFPRAIDSYTDGNAQNLGEKLLIRIQEEPFNLAATLIFLGAIIHTFLAGKFTKLSHRIQHDLESLAGPETEIRHVRDRLQFRAQLFHFLGEVEAVFGIWLIPLAVAIVGWKNWDVFVHYTSKASYAEPIFVVVVMAMASSRPVLQFAENSLARVASLGGGGPAAWWVSVLTVGPIMGSFITEPAAMTICALLLSRKFYALHPSMGLRYATLGLLFVNISVGGTLTHFAAPPVVMVAGKWGWGLWHMFHEFGWRAVIGILIANFLYFLKFRRELSGLKADSDSHAGEGLPVPASVVITHLLFIAWAVFTAHNPPLVVLGLLFFLAYVEATRHHQRAVGLRAPMLVGFFLAALVVHGGCQQWWIAPVLGSLGKWPLMLGSTALTALNDNAAITYLASLVPNFSDEMKHAVVVGAVTGGGLTVIANAPNPAGQSILQRHFGPDGISPLKLFVSALIPTIIMGAALMFLP